MQQAYLSDLKVGDQGRVIGFAQGEKAYRKKLLALGLIPGTAFRITRYAPMGDPVEIAVRGFALTLRQAEAQILRVERISAA